jgi:hypothetical protein
VDDTLWYQQKYQPSDSNKNVDITFSVHGTFLV